MDRNCERNLAKVEALRARGELTKARRKLEELVRDHPDVPDYRLELARVCFELGDAHAGLAEVRQLQRQDPSQRRELMELSRHHFEQSANLPAGQFLCEEYLASGEHDEIDHILEAMSPEQIQQLLDRYAVKLTNIENHRESEAGARNSENTAACQARWVSFHGALALKQPALAAEHGRRLLQDGDSQSEELLALLERRQRLLGTMPWLLVLLGEARIRAGRPVEGLVALYGAAERDRTLISASEEICERLGPKLQDLAAAQRTRGHLARLAGRHEEAARWYRQAVEREPQGIPLLLEMLPTDESGEAGGLYALLRVEMLARAGNGDSLAAAIQQLRRTGKTTARQLRELLSDQLTDEQNSPAVLLCAAQLAIEDDDPAGLERLLPACARLGRTPQAKLIQAVEARLGLVSTTADMVPDPITGELVAPTNAAGQGKVITGPARGVWLRLLVRLHAGLRDAQSVNARLVRMWEEWAAGAEANGDDSYTELLRFTTDVLAAIPPEPATLLALLPPLAARSDFEAFAPLLSAVAASDEAGFRPVADRLAETASQSDGDAAALRACLATVNGPAAAALAFPLAVAQLCSGDVEAGVAGLAAYCAGRPERDARVLELYRSYSREHEPHATVALAAARLLRLEDRLDEAIALLRPVIEHQPQRAGEISLFCESVLADEPDLPDVWRCYLDGLLRAGRFQRLMQVLPKAEQALPAREIGRLRVYRARLLYEEGDLAGALAESEFVLQLADPPWADLGELAAALVTVDDRLSRAHKLAGIVAVAAGKLVDGLDSFRRAWRREPALLPEILGAVHGSLQQRLAEPPECVALASFYREVGRPDEAVQAALEALRVDPSCAAEIVAQLQDLTMAGQGGTRSLEPTSAPLLLPLALALRLSDRLEEAADVYLLLHAVDPTRQEWILKELAAIEATRPGHQAPVKVRARLLLAQRRFEQLGELLARRPELAAVVLPDPDELERDLLAQAWQACATLPQAVAGRPDVLLLAARYLHALDRPTEVLALVDRLAESTRREAGDGVASVREEAAKLRAQAYAALGRHDEAVATMQDAMREPQVQDAAIAFIEQKRATEAEDFVASRGGESALDDAQRREAARRLRLAGRRDEALRLLAEPVAAPGQEQARVLARAELLAASDREGEAADLLRSIPLASPACQLTTPERVLALWLLAHGEESRGNFPAALACYRHLADLPGSPGTVLRWRNWCYGNYLRHTSDEVPLLLEKTTALA